MTRNKLYFGDNLDILIQLSTEYPKGFIDLIYIDPPFNSKRNYNVLFESIDLVDSTAQKQAFADTWSNVSYMDSLNLLSDLNINLYNFLKNLENTGISISAISYLTTMAIRVHYMHRLLKDTGSFYLHCDPTMSHYLKLLCDIIFGEKNFKNEIVWQRTNAHNMKTPSFGRVHDIILFYSKSGKCTWNGIYEEYSDEQLSRFRKDPDGRLYKAENLTYSTANPQRQFEWRGTKPPSNRSWGYPLEKLEELWKEGKILAKSDGSPRQDGLKVYLDDLPGKALNDVWIDIQRIGNTSDERLGYPTQKPLALMQRIIEASSNEGDLVADFFCGCGTTIDAAEKLNRKWLGVDISHLAVRLIANRIGKDELNKTYEIHGFPQDIDSAKELAENVKGGRLEFEEWIVEYLLHGILNEKRNEMGFDGYRTFSTFESEKQIVMIEVKSGNATVTQISHFINIVDDKKGSIGVFVCWKDQITKNMEILAKKAGYYELNNAPYCDKIQIISVEDLLEGKLPKIPESKRETFKKTVKKSKPEGLDQTLDF